MKRPIAKYHLKHAKWTKGLQKLVISFLNADDNLDSHQNLIITFWSICNVPRNLHANSFRDFCIKSTNQQENACENN